MDKIRLRGKLPNDDYAPAEIILSLESLAKQLTSHTMAELENEFHNFMRSKYTDTPKQPEVCKCGCGLTREQINKHQFLKSEVLLCESCIKIDVCGLYNYNYGNKEGLDKVIDCKYYKPISDKPADKPKKIELLNIRDILDIARISTQKREHVVAIQNAINQLRTKVEELIEAYNSKV